MPGGTKAAYEHLEPILTKIAAQVDDGPVSPTLVLMVALYVKWFTTELRYGDMQLIAEAYDLLKSALGLDHTQLHEIFAGGTPLTNSIPI